MPRITVIVSPDAKVIVEGHEFQGAECLKATEAIRQAIGQTTGDRKKPEFHPPTIITTQDQNRHASQY